MQGVMFVTGRKKINPGTVFLQSVLKHIHNLIKILDTTDKLKTCFIGIL